MNKPLIPAAVALCFCLSIIFGSDLIRMVQAQTSQTSSNRTLNVSSTGDSSASYTSCNLSVKHCNTDFTASPGAVYIVDKPGVICTLSSAANVQGKEILVIPNYRTKRMQARFNGIFFQTVNGEGLCAYGRSYQRPMICYSEYALTRVISDGQNWFYESPGDPGIRGIPGIHMEWK